MFEYHAAGKNGTTSRRERSVALTVSLILHGLLVYWMVQARITVKILDVKKEQVQPVVLSPPLKVSLPKIVGGRSTVTVEELQAGPEGGGAARAGAGKAVERPETRPVEAAGAAAGSSTVPSLSREFQRSMTSRPGAKSGSGLSITLGPPGSTAGGSPPAGSDRGLPPDLIRGLPGAGVTGGVPGFPGGTGRAGRAGRGFKSQRLGISIPAGGFDFGPWAVLVVDSIQKNWELPASGKLARSARVRFSVIINKKGELSSIEIIEISSIESLDQAALAALRASLPFPALPADFPGDLLEILFEFVYDD
jgi:TonB family protein